MLTINCHRFIKVHIYKCSYICVLIHIMFKVVTTTTNFKVCLQQLCAEEVSSEGGGSCFSFIYSKFGPSALVEKDMKACLLLSVRESFITCSYGLLTPLFIPPLNAEVVDEIFTHSHSCFPANLCSFTSHARSRLHFTYLSFTKPHHLTTSSEFVRFYPPLSSKSTHPHDFSLSSSVGPPAVFLCHFFDFVPILTTPLFLPLFFLLRRLDLCGCISHTGELVCLLTGVCLLVIWEDNVLCQQKKMLAGHERWQKPELLMTLEA